MLSIAHVGLSMPRTVKKDRPKVSHWKAAAVFSQPVQYDASTTDPLQRLPLRPLVQESFSDNYRPMIGFSLTSCCLSLWHHCKGVYLSSKIAHISYNLSREKIVKKKKILYKSGQASSSQVILQADKVPFNKTIKILHDSRMVNYLDVFTTLYHWGFKTSAWTVKQLFDYQFVKGTQWLGSVELVHLKRLKPIIIKSIWLERCFKSRI